MTSSTSNLALTLYDSTTDQSVTFLNYRLQISGPSSSSNFYKIDTWAGTVNSAITTLQANRGATPVAANYISANYYTATVTGFTAYATGAIIALSLDTTSNGTVTLDINSLGIKSLMKVNYAGTPVNLTNADLNINKIYLFEYDGTRWLWVNALAADQIYIPGTSGNVVTINSDNTLLGTTTQSVLLSGTTHSATTKTPPVGADELPIVDSAASNVLKKLTWANAKSAMGVIDGWIPAEQTWAYASGTTITVPTGAASIYATGDKWKLTSNGVVLYGYIVTVADTLLTVSGNTLTNYTYTANCYSRATSPIGFPVYFTGLPTSTTLPAATDIFETIESMGTTPTKKRKAWSVLQTAVLPTPNQYERDVRFTGSVTTITTPNSMWVNINNLLRIISTQTTLPLGTAGSWDTTAGTDYTVAANRAGKDFYIYACENSVLAPILLLSANATNPSGYTTTTSRKIGGFHCLCVAAGTISGHTLTGYAAGSILPQSVWDLKWQPRNLNPAGMVYSSAANIWVDIYLMSGTGASTLSVNGGTISDTRNWMDFVDDCGAVGKRLLRDCEFQVIAAGCNEGTNITGSADPTTTGGHSDTAGRRMLSNIGCEDCAGAMWQWLDEQSFQYASTATFGWVNQTGGKGQLFLQGATADVKLIAGGSWGSGASCGSRSREASSYRWVTSASVGGRAGVEPL
jgi:hypothetical protein